MSFQKAQRCAAKLRLALTGPSGSGKTFSAIKIAQGLGQRIAIIDSERGSASLYAHLGNFDVCNITPPYSPQNYSNFITEAENAGYEVLIIDSLSHCWSGEGGILDIHDNASKATRNSFTAWREVTPAHNALVNQILASNMHIITTLRTKTAYEVVNDNGKTKVQKVGLAAIQKEGLEYEFTAVLDLSVDGHIATSSKDRTGLFDGQYFKPDTQTGRLLKNWLDGNENVNMPLTNPATPTAQTNLQTPPRRATTPARGTQRQYAA